MARFHPAIPAYSSSRSPVSLNSLLLILTLAGSTVRGGDGTEAFFVAPKKLFPGSEASVILYTFSISGEVGIPRSAPFDVFLSPSSDPDRPIASGTTDSEGWSNLPIRIQRSEAPGLHYLVAKVTGLDEPLFIPVTLVETRMLLVETDKPIYKPGQILHGRVLLLDNTLKPLPGEGEVEIRDAKRNKIYRQTFTANRFGVAPFELPLARELNQGGWTIHARSGEAVADVTVEVEPYVLPRFRVEVAFDKDWYLPTEPISGEVRSSYFFGKPVDGEVVAVASRLTEDGWEEYARYSTRMEGGAARFAVEPVQVLPRPGDSGTGVSIEFQVTDAAGHPEKSKQLASIAETPFRVSIACRSTSAKPGMPLDVLVETTDPAGRPLSRPVTVNLMANDDNGQLIAQLYRTISTQAGKAGVSFDVPAEAQYLVLEAETGEGSSRAIARRYGPVGYSPTGNFLQVERAADGPVTVGDTAEFQVIGTAPGATFYEVLAGGRAVLSGRGGDVIRFAALPAMAPQAKLIVYRIFPTNEVGTDSFTFAVRPSAESSLAVSFDASRVEPGSPVKLEVSAGVESMVGVAIVDESVLALHQGRLELDRIYQEVSSRFGGLSDAEFLTDFAERPHTMGSLDILESVGRGVAVSPGADSISLRFPQGYSFWPGSYATTGSYSLPPPDGEAGLAQVERVRQFFPETWVWEPLLLTDTAGRATLELTAPDSITNWKLRAVSTSSDGLGLAGGDLVVFQDFFVEPDLPYALTRGEEAWIPVAVYNYLDRTQEVVLELEPSEGFEVLGSPSVTVSMGPSEVKGATFPVRATGIGTFPFKLIARGPLKADAVVRPLLVEPEGSRQESVENVALSPGQSHTFDASFPLETVPGSTKLLLSLTGSQLTQTINGVEDLCGMPYGCGEQNMLFTSVDVEALRYLRARGEPNGGLEAKLLEFLCEGYQRELLYQHPDGWFNAFVFEGSIGSLWLTSYVLSVFSQARPLITIDDEVLAKAADWIQGLQDADGGWQPFGFVIHKELEGGLQGSYALTAFVTLALIEYGASDAVLARARGYLESHLAEVDSPHSLAMGSYALALLKSPSAAPALDRLLSLARVDEEGRLSWGPVEMETTSYAVLALHETGRPLPASSAASWIAAGKNSRGGFGNTQDTVMALKALVHDSIASSQGTDARVDILRDGQLVQTARLDPSNVDVLQQFSFDEGADLDVETSGKGPVQVQLSRHYNVPTETLLSRGGLELRLDYASARAAVGGQVLLEAGVRYTGPREETNMAIAEIGIPTGLRPDRAALDGLIGQSASPLSQIRRIDVQGRAIAIYIDRIEKGETVTIPITFTAAFAARSAPVPSRAYDYYDPTIAATDRGRVLVIGEAGDELPFIRGDASEDGQVDLTDVIRMLGALYLESAPIPCADAFDANDDGGADISDPIALLFYLYAAGEPPPSPFPQMGEDPTADTLACHG
jgi:CD109 antigen